MMRRKFMLLCGVLSPLLYAVADGIAGIRSEGYSFADQTISELGAIEAPSRPLFSGLLIPVYLLLVAFGIGVRRSAEGRRALKGTGSILVALGLMALTVGQFVPMHVRGTHQGTSGLLHVIEGGVAMLMILAAIGLAAMSLGARFRFYSVATVIVLLVFGAWTVVDGPRIAEGLPTPWVGVKERIWWYAYQLWFLVLAVRLLRDVSASQEEPAPSQR